MLQGKQTTFCLLFLGFWPSHPFPPRHTPECWRPHVYLGWPHLLSLFTFLPEALLPLGQSLASRFCPLGFILNAAIWLSILKQDYCRSLALSEKPVCFSIYCEMKPKSGIKYPPEGGFQCFSKLFSVLNTPLQTGSPTHLSIYSSMYLLKIYWLMSTTSRHYDRLWEYRYNSDMVLGTRGFRLVRKTVRAWAIHMIKHGKLITKCHTDNVQW